jgi:hypothetical protein
MKEELFNYTVKKYQVSEFLDTNPIRPLKKEVEDDFDWGVIETSLSSKRHTSYTPWGDYTFKADYDTEEKFVEHYGNPFAQLYFNRVIVSVTKENDKVSFKVFNYYKSRRVAGKWFKLRTNCKFITFNYKTNALYTGSLDNYHLKRKCRKRVSRVLFNNDPINQMRRHLRDSFNTIVDKDKVDIPTIVNQVISTFVNAIPGTELYANLLPEQRIYKRYLDAQGIKVPNNWFELMNTYPQPKKKDLVKCGYKYIDALMRVHNLKGDKVKRVLHNVKSFEGVNNFNNACSIFGDKFILNQQDEFIQLLLEKSQPGFHNNIGKGLLTKKEFSNFFEIYKLFQKGLVNHYVIEDHFRFYRLLDQMEPVKWTSSTHDEFVQEHYDWSEKYNHYTNGDFTRIYNQGFIDKINEVILTKDGPYFPEVLTTSKRYNNESFFQSNCVKTYVKSVGSVLISLRRGEGETEERASIEIEVTPLVWPDEMYFNLRRVQTLGKRNTRLDNSWDDVLSKLDERIEYIVRERLFDTLQIGGEFGGRKVFSDYVIKEYDRPQVDWNVGVVKNMKKGVYLAWENDSIMKLNSYNLNTITIYNDPDELDF